MKEADVIKENLNNIKSQIDWMKVALWITIIILSFFLFKSCEGSKELDLTIKASEQKVKTLESESQKYVDIANQYKDTVTLLKNKKIKVKEKLVSATKDTEKQIKEVPKLQTKGIATYFQDNYKLPLVITQYGVAVSDTLGKAVITDLIKGQGYKTQLKLTQQLLKIEEKSGVAKDSTIVNLEKSGVVKDSISLVKEGTILDLKSLNKKEKNKKTFWQVTAGVAITLATWFAVKP
jgi:hypothetical protein